MTLNSVPLRPVPDALRVEDEDMVLRRHKRNWVWNQFFVLEEYTGDDPLYVGKVSQGNSVILRGGKNHAQITVSGCTPILNTVL